MRHRIRNPCASTQFQISVKIGFRFVMHRIIPWIFNYVLGGDGNKFLFPEFPIVLLSRLLQRHHRKFVVYKMQLESNVNIKYLESDGKDDIQMQRSEREVKINISICVTKNEKQTAKVASFWFIFMCIALTDVDFFKDRGDFSLNEFTPKLKCFFPLEGCTMYIHVYRISACGYHHDVSWLFTEVFTLIS